MAIPIGAILSGLGLLTQAGGIWNQKRMGDEQRRAAAFGQQGRQQEPDAFTMLLPLLQSAIASAQQRYSIGQQSQAFNQTPMPMQAPAGGVPDNYFRMRMLGLM